MKNIILIFCLAIIGFAASGCKNQGAPGTVNSFKRYAFKNAHIVLRHSGDTRGNEDIYIADYGKYEARLTNIEMFRGEATLPRQMVDITRIADLYNVNLQNHQVRHQHNPMLDSMYRLPEGDIPTPQQFTDYQMKEGYYKNEGPDTAAGFKATRWFSPDNQSKFWIWNTFAVKQIYPTQDGFIGITLESMDTNWVVDTNTFSLPTQGFERTEVKPGEPLQQM